MADEKKTYTIFDNDYVAYCDAVAKDYPSYMHDFFPDFPNIADDAAEILSDLGMPSEDIDKLLEEASAKSTDDDALDLLSSKMQELETDDVKKGITRSWFSDKMLDDTTGFFSDHFNNLAHEDIQADYESILNIDPKEPHLCLGSNMGWQNLEGMAIFEPDQDIATSLIQAENTDTLLQMTYTEGDPCLRATAYTHDSPTGESFIIIPQSMARQAFESKELHEKLSGILAKDDDVKEFLYDAKAIPELEKDPVAYGIVDGMIDYATPFVSSKEASMRELAAKKIANFSLQGCESYCKEAGDLVLPSEATRIHGDNPYYIADSLKESTYGYLDELEQARESSLTRGIEKVLQMHPDKIHEMLEPLVNHPKKAISAIQKLGQEPAR